MLHLKILVSLLMLMRIAHARRPNLITVLSDDHGYADLGT
jgi:hypothetical protein